MKFDLYCNVTVYLEASHRDAMNENNKDEEKKRLERSDPSLYTNAFPCPHAVRSRKSFPRYLVNLVIRPVGARLGLAPKGERWNRDSGDDAISLSQHRLFISEFLKN